MLRGGFVDCRWKSVDGKADNNIVTFGEIVAGRRAAGFDVPDSAVSYPFMWWSREDLGLMERVLRIKPPAVREETLINLIARKP